MYLSIIEDFAFWNEWYASQKITLAVLDETLIGKENQLVVIRGNGNQDLGIVKGSYLIKTKYYSPCNVKSKNIEQQAALTILGDNSIPLKILSGSAGSGKTLLASAHAIHRLDKGFCSKIVIAKSMAPVGKEIGFLKGDMKEKVLPWLGPFTDNFIHCGLPPYQLEAMIDKGTLEITPITFIQGRSISDAVIIIDEVQNLDLNIVKQIITRAADNTEIIMLGDPTQVFDRSVKEDTLTILAERGEASPLVGHVRLVRSVRSPLAQWAVETL